MQNVKFLIYSNLEITNFFKENNSNKLVFSYSEEYILIFYNIILNIFENIFLYINYFTTIYIFKKKEYILILF